MSDLPERIASKIDKLSALPCWLWTGQISNRGYGVVQYQRRPHGAHRVVYEMLVSPIPQGLHLDHLCRARTCVNPAHLEPVTAHENNLRCPTWNGNKTHCKHGHLFDEANTYHHNGGRFCRECRRLSAARFRRKVLS